MTTDFETGEEPNFDGDPKLSVVLVYEDLSTGLRIKRTFDHVVSRLAWRPEVHLNAWRLDVLREPVLKRQAESDAADADIVMLSTHGRGQLPAEIKACLCQWLEQECDSRPHALVVSIDADAKESVEAAETLGYLRSLAEQAGLDMFIHFGNAPRLGSESTMESIRQRADVTTKVLEGILYRSSPPPRWGINE